MISRWGVACGMDNYVRELVDSVADDVDVAVFANREPQAVDHECGRLYRDWDAASGDAQRLLADLAGFAPDVMHIQYNLGYIGIDLLEAVLGHARQARIPAILQIHAIASADYSAGADARSLRDILPLLTDVSCILVHGESDRVRLAGWGLSANVRVWRLGERAWPRFDSTEVRSLLGIQSRCPVIATFGFLQQRKGTLDLIAATDIVRRGHPSALLIACNALHPRCGPSDYRYYNACRAEIARRGLESSVALVTTYLPQGTAMVLLQAADVIVLPHRDTPEGTSAAAKFCAAAGRPLVLSQEQIFDAYRDASWELPDTGPASIAQAVETLLRSPSEAKRLAALAAQLADSLSWTYLSREYRAMLAEVTAKLGWVGGAHD